MYGNKAILRRIGLTFNSLLIEIFLEKHWKEDVEKWLEWVQAFNSLLIEIFLEYKQMQSSQEIQLPYSFQFSFN